MDSSRNLSRMDSIQTGILDNDLEMEKKQISFFSILCTRSQLLRQFQICCLVIAIYIAYGTSIMLNKDLGIDNIYLSGSLLCLFELIGYGLGGFYSDRFGRKQINIWVNIIILACSLTIMIMDLISDIFIDFDKRPGAIRILELSKSIKWFNIYDHFSYISERKIWSFCLNYLNLISNSDFQTRFLIIVLGLVIKLTICFQFGSVYNYIVELVPSELRGFSIGFALSIGKIMQGLGTYLILFGNLIHVNPMSMGLFYVLFSFPNSLTLPETKEKKLEN